MINGSQVFENRAAHSGYAAETVTPGVETPKISAGRVELPFSASKTGVLPLDETEIFGASGKNRTCDNRIFRPALYQLSYRGIGGHDRSRTCDSGVAVRRLQPLGYMTLIWFPLRDSNSHLRLQRPVSCLLDEAESFPAHIKRAGIFS